MSVSPGARALRSASRSAAVCCGTKRMVEIRCPPDCHYLETSRTHPAAVIRRQQEMDLRVFLPTVQDLPDEQAQMLWFVLSAGSRVPA